MLRICSRKIFGGGGGGGGGGGEKLDLELLPRSFIKHEDQGPTASVVWFAQESEM